MIKMKTLQISIIVISGIVLIVSTNLSFAEQSSITVKTNLENYATTDKMIITTHITNPNNNTSLWIKIFAPNHDLESYRMFPQSSNESYTWIISPIEFYNSGNYTVTAQYGQGYAVAHFHLNSTLIQYYQSQSPLKQYKIADAQDVHCHSGLQLALKAEDYSPACLKPETATKLIQRGWALDTTSPVPFIKKMWITGLQNYTVGQTINATVNYVGYYWYTEPEVKILDANGTQIWFNCPYCYARSEKVPFPSLGTFTYIVRDYSSNTPPVINKTGTYTMVASIGNKTAEAKFDIIPASLQQTIPNPISNSTSNAPEFKVGPDLLGPIPHQLVFFIKSNSTAKIFVEYTSNEPNTGTIPSYSSVYVGKENFTPLATSVITINADPSSIPLTEGSHTTVVYNVTAKEGVKGVYWISLVQFCRVMPLAVDINSLTISPFDIPVQMGMMSCPAQVLDGKILGISGGTAEYKIGQPVK